MKRALRRGLLASIFTIFAVNGDSSYHSPFLKDTTHNNYPYPESAFSVDREQRFPVHYAPKTATLFSDEIKEIIAKRSEREIFIVSADDLSAINEPTRLPHWLEQLLHLLEQTGVWGWVNNIHSDVRTQKERQIKALFPSLSNYSTPRLHSIYDNAMNDNPAAMPLFDSNGNVTGCIIAITGEKPHVARLSSLANALFINTSGNKNLWRDLVLIHEEFHCNDNHLQQTIALTQQKSAKGQSLSVEDINALDQAIINTEFNADQHMIHYLNMQLAQGREEYRGMREELIAARAIGIFNRYFETHSHAGFLSLGHSVDFYNDRAEQIQEDTEILIVFLHHHVGGKFMTDERRAYALRSVLEGTLSSLPASQKEFYEDLIARIGSAIELPDEDKTKSRLLRSIISEGTKDPEINKRYKDARIRAQINLGLARILDDRYNAYEALVHFSTGWGAFFLKSREQREIALRARLAYERYAPHHMKPKEEVPQQTNTPQQQATPPTPKV